MRVKFSNNKYIHYIQQANYARLINRCTDTFRLLQGYIAERRMPNKERRTPNAKHRTPNAERRIRKHCLLGVRFTQVSLWFIKPGSHLRHKFLRCRKVLLYVCIRSCPRQLKRLSFESHLTTKLPVTST